MSVLLFFVGFWIGGIIGVFIMCLFQVSGSCENQENFEDCSSNRTESILHEKYYNGSDETK